MNVEALDWRALVEEARRRRAEEGLTQRDLAALAGVSAPTVISFERGDTRLRLDKVFDILTALGLLHDSGAVGGQESFVQAARRRWSDLVGSLPDESAPRFPFGYAEYDYEIVPVPSAVPLSDLQHILRDIGQGETGWSPFWFPTRERIKPYTRDGTVECWLGESDHGSGDAAYADFWRVSAVGQAYLRRGYQEDGADVLEPGAFFDLSLPIWRTAEVLLHAARLARAINANGATIRFRLRLEGLSGRELLSWAKPNRRQLVPGSWRARANNVTSAVEVSPDVIDNELPALIAGLLQPVYARFDGFSPPPDLYAEEIAELRLGRDRRRRRTPKTPS